jgi:hypothetical protein
MLALLNEKIQSPSTPKGRAAYIKSLTAWSKAATQVAQSYLEKLNDMDAPKATPSGGETPWSTLNGLLFSAASALSGIERYAEKLK